MDNEPVEGTLGLDMSPKAQFKANKWATMFLRLVDKCGISCVKEMLLTMSYLMSDLGKHDEMIKHLEKCIEEINLDALKKFEK